MHDDKDPTAVPDEVRKQGAIDAQERMKIWGNESGCLKGLRVGIPQVRSLCIHSHGIIKRLRRSIFLQSYHLSFASASSISFQG